jgi:hypothetical protein
MRRAAGLGPRKAIWDPQPEPCTHGEDEAIPTTTSTLYVRKPASAGTSASSKNDDQGPRRIP